MEKTKEVPNQWEPLFAVVSLKNNLSIGGAIKVVNIMPGPTARAERLSIPVR
ncbi:hypothetical protein [Paenibacillus aestuarii]|uniref:Uncharacterized protein n=1 Tax=Paenibacillus aestuarii TaxID=516965 RepID=A0ABW0K1W1_9BACL